MMQERELEAKNRGVSVKQELLQLAARSQFAADWYKSGRYYRRSGLHTRLSDFLNGDDRQWMLPIHAAGGMGKTMLLRAWIARDLVLAGVKVAKVDFDEVHWRHLEQDPWFHFHRRQKFGSYPAKPLHEQEQRQAVQTLH